MDVFSRLYHILRARSAGDGDELGEPPVAGTAGTGRSTWSESKQAQNEQNATPRQDPSLAVYYANLEIPYGSDISTAKKAWKNMMKQYHPDLHSSDPKQRKVANELCAELTRAYQELARLSG